MNKMTKLALAASAATMFSMAAAPTVFAADAASAPVHCMGINSCKGTGKCATAEHSCAGQNSCKGMGWLPKASAEECTKAGGTVTK